jgi:hypothetical protein
LHSTGRLLEGERVWWHEFSVRRIPSTTNRSKYDNPENRKIENRRLSSSRRLPTARENRSRASCANSRYQVSAHAQAVGLQRTGSRLLDRIKIYRRTLAEDLRNAEVRATLRRKYQGAFSALMDACWHRAVSH